jgi:hypothetical protein
MTSSCRCDIRCVGRSSWFRKHTIPWKSHGEESLWCVLLFEREINE